MTTDDLLREIREVRPIYAEAIGEMAETLDRVAASPLKERAEMAAVLRRVEEWLTHDAPRPCASPLWAMRHQQAEIAALRRELAAARAAYEEASWQRQQARSYAADLAAGLDMTCVPESTMSIKTIAALQWVERELHKKG